MAQAQPTTNNQQSTPSITLPTEKSKPKSDVRDFTTLIYGQPKIGKSTFCSQTDNALFLATEAGLNNLEVFQIPITNWDEFLAAGALLYKGGHSFRTIVIDTIDNLYKYCVDHVLRKNNLQHQSDLEFGKGYDLVNTEFQKRLTALSLLPYGLMMISHAIEKEIKTRTGKEVRITPTLPGSARKIVIGMADFILYAESAEIRDDDGAITGYERVIRTKPTTIYEAGDRTGRLPETLPLSYQAFAKALQPTSTPAAARVEEKAKPQSMEEKSKQAQPTK